MLFSRRLLPSCFPFNQSQLRYFYFARNAVWLAAKMLNLERGEVLVPAYHHGVEIEALAAAGARLKFYRVGPRWDVDLEDVERNITPSTRALYLTHYAGFPGPAEQMKKIAEDRGLALIEDCALSLFSSEGTQPLGSTGDLSVFCIYKTLPVPHGGALLVNGSARFSLPNPPPPAWSSTWHLIVSSLLQNLEYRAGAFGRWVRVAIRRFGKSAAQATHLRSIPTGTLHFNPEHVHLGMSRLAMRISRAQDWRATVEARRRNYFFLLGRLRDVAPPLFSELPWGVCPLFYPLQVEDKLGVMAALARRGIETVDFWRYFHPACDPAKFPEVAKLRRTILELPCHQDLDAEVMGKVVAAVREVLGRQSYSLLNRARL
jgi:dTDP-4-amino-4,6-dideoxygalactose transaminase